MTTISSTNVETGDIICINPSNRKRPVNLRVTSVIATAPPRVSVIGYQQYAKGGDRPAKSAVMLGDYVTLISKGN